LTVAVAVDKSAPQAGHWVCASKHGPRQRGQIFIEGVFAAAYNRDFCGAPLQCNEAGLEPSTLGAGRVACVADGPRRGPVDLLVFRDSMTKDPHAPDDHGPVAEAAETRVPGEPEQRPLIPFPRAAVPEDIDPELLKLPRRIRRPRPVVAAVLLIFTGYVAWMLHRDLRYFLGPHAPTDLGPVRGLDLSTLKDGTYATLHGTPSRPDTAVLSERGSSGVSLVAPFAGTSGTVLVDTGASDRRGDEVFDDAYTGRLRQLDATAFGDEARRYFGAALLPRYLRPQDLVSALVGHASSASDELGAPVDLSPDATVVLTLQIPEDAVLSFDRERFTDADAEALAARLAAGVGGAASAGPAGEATADSITYVVRIPGGLDGDAARGLRAALANYGDAIELGARQVDVTLPLSQVSPDPAGGLVLPGAVAPVAYRLNEAASQPAASAPASQASRATPAASSPASQAIPLARLVPAPAASSARIALTSVARVRILAPETLPADCWILVEGDAPAQYWYLPLVYVLLAAVALFNALALRAGLRARKQGET
jgi:hypothetical protein